MKITRLGGITYANDTVLANADKIECIFEANGAITVGSSVIHENTSVNGTLVVIGSTAADIATSDHKFVGIYEGIGGSGTLTTTSGLTGRAAADGDIIMVTTYGPAIALVSGETADVAAGSALTLSTTVNGEIVNLGTTFDAGDVPMLIACEGNQGTTAARDVFVKAM